MNNNADNPHSVCVVVIKDGLFLGVSRKNDLNDMGLPGGKVEPDESLKQAIIREVKEETGFTLINPIEFFSKEYNNYMAHCFIAKISGTMIYDASVETGRVAWITKQELIAGSFGDYNEEVFNILSTLNILK